MSSSNNCSQYFFISVSVLDPVRGMTIDDMTTTTYLVTWQEAQGNFDGYVVECNCTENDPNICSDQTSTELPPGNLTYTCTGLTPGSTYKTYVRTVRKNWLDAIHSTSSDTDTSTCMSDYFYF